MGEEYMKPVPLPTDQNEVVQVVITVRQLPVLRALAKVVDHRVVGPFQVGDDDTPTFFFHPVIDEEH